MDNVNSDQEGIDTITPRVTPEGFVTLTLPKPKFGAIFEEPQLLTPIIGLEEQDLMMGGEIQMVSCGLPLLLFPIKDFSTLILAKLNQKDLDSIKSKVDFGELCLWCPGDSPGSYHIRMLSCAPGRTQALVLGPACGALVCYLLRNGYADLDQGVLRIVVRHGTSQGNLDIINAQTSYGPQGYFNIEVSGQTSTLS